MYIRHPVIRLLLLLLSCAGCQEPATDQIKANAVLVFEDHFEGKVLDTTKWYTYSSNPKPFDRILPRGNCDYETAALLLDRNIIIRDGHLNLIARQEAARYEGIVDGEAGQDIGCGHVGQDTFLLEQEYTSATLRSRKGYNHGYFECRAKIPPATGLYPVIWLWHHDELVLFEFFGDSKTYYASSHHGANYKTKAFYEVADYSEAFHVYGLNWTPNRLTWYFDHKPIWELEREKGLGLAPGNDFFPDSTDRWLSPNISLRVYEWAAQVDDQRLPDTLKIDYFKVYQSQSDVPD